MARLCCFCSSALWLLAALWLLISYAMASPSGTSIYSFDDLPNGGFPNANVISDGAGNLYGTTYWGGTYSEGVIFELSPGANGQWKEKVLYSFTGAQDGCHPASGLARDVAGNLYGTTVYGGGADVYGLNSCYAGLLGGNGVVFELSPSANGTWKETVLHSFTVTDGSSPLTGLIFDNAGNIYGSTYGGGTGGHGVIYEISMNSQGQWTESVLYNFTGGIDGGDPSGVVFDHAGNLYGVANYGGDLNCNNYGNRNPGCGLVFQLTNNGAGAWTENYLHVFAQFDGAFPYGSLVLDFAGNLYGTTLGGPSVGCDYSGAYCGTVFSIANNASWTFTTLYTFLGGADGAYPNGNLVFDASGNLYGTTAYGGGATNCYFYGCGTAFELSPRQGVWQERVLSRFGVPGVNTLAFPQGGLTFDAFGNAYAVIGSSYGYADGAVVKLAPSSTDPWILTSLHDFFPRGEGAPSLYPPSSGLIADSIGNLYGTTQYGGRWRNGTVFELSPQPNGVWLERILYSFTGLGDGAQPQASLVFDSAGNLYGTTAFGGSTTCLYFGGCGVAFELSKSGNSWKESVLYTFAGTTDGGFPDSPLIFDKNGNLYGTAGGGGSTSSACSPYNGCGTVFELIPSSGGWREQTLYTFQFGSDGAEPWSLIFDKSGNLYGTTRSGGGNYLGNCFLSGCGTVFELTPNGGGWSESILYAFQGTADGSGPAGLAIDSQGNLYGTTYYGGVGGLCQNNCGTVFELSAAGGKWNKTVLYEFQPRQVVGDGMNPESGVVLDTAGNLYGTTRAGGYYGSSAGTVFRLSTSSGGGWVETILEKFPGQYGGSAPVGPVMLDSAGNLFGIAAQGGDTGWGLVYEIPASGINAAADDSGASSVRPRSTQMPPMLNPAGIPASVLPPRPDHPVVNSMANPLAGGKVQ